MISISDFGCVCSSGNSISEIISNIDKKEKINIICPFDGFLEKCAVIDNDKKGLKKIKFICKQAFSQLSKDTLEKISENTLFCFATCCGEFPNDLKYNLLTPHEVSQIISKHLGFKRCDVTFVNACSASSVAIASSSMLVDSGKYKNAVIVCYDIISEQVFSGFKSLGAMSDDFCSYEKMNGMSLGEAAVVLFVDRNSNGNYLCGCGITNDAYHMVQPNCDGVQKLISMKLAIGENCFPDYINMHSTGTVKNEDSEMVAINQLLKWKQPIIERTKYITGHCLGASGALECIISLERLKNLKRVMSNTFAFGGTNVSLMFSNESSDAFKTMKIANIQIGAYEFSTTEKSVDDDIIQLGKTQLKYRKYSIEDKLVSVSLEKSVLSRQNIDKGRVAHIFVSDIGPKRTVSQFSKNVLENGIKSASAFQFPNTVWNAPQGCALINTGITGFNVSVMGCSESFIDEFSLLLLQCDISDIVFVTVLYENEGNLESRTKIVEMK